MNSKGHSTPPSIANSMRPAVPAAKERGLEVELVTALGCVFTGRVSGIEMELSTGTFDLSSPGATYFTLEKVTQLVLRSGSGTCGFRLENASASLRAEKLTVVAETIEPAIVLERLPLTGRF